MLKNFHVHCTRLTVLCNCQYHTCVVGMHSIASPLALVPPASDADNSGVEAMEVVVCWVKRIEGEFVNSYVLASPRPDLRNVSCASSRSFRSFANSRFNMAFCISSSLLFSLFALFMANFFFDIDYSWIRNALFCETFCSLPGVASSLPSDKSDSPPEG